MSGWGRIIANGVYNTKKVMRARKRRKSLSEVPWRVLRREISREFYKSREWREVRYRALKLHGGCCQLCGRRGGHDVVLHVDHIKPRSTHPNLQLELSNLQVLCEDCNLGKSARDQTDWRSNGDRSAASQGISAMDGTLKA